MRDKDRIAELLADFPVRVEAPVAWGHLDAVGHVNDTVYFSLLRDRADQVLRRARPGSHRAVRRCRPDPALGELRFRIPLTYPDTVTVGARIGDVGEDRFVMLHRALSYRHGAVAADGESLSATFAYATGIKARVSDDLRAPLLELRGDAGWLPRPAQQRPPELRIDVASKLMVLTRAAGTCYRGGAVGARSDSMSAELERVAQLAGELDVDGLGLEVLLDRGDAVLTAEP